MSKHLAPSLSADARCWRYRPGGYTLVEVLIAVMVFALLAASAYVALDGLSRAATEHRERAGAFAELQLAMTRLDADLRQLASRPVRGPDGQQRPAVSGERTRLSATRAGWANPADQPRSNLQRFSWQYSDGELLRSSWPVTDRTPATRTMTESVLGGARSLEFRFRGHEGRWRDYWPPDPEQRQRLPVAIEVSVETERFGRLRRLVVLQ